MTFDWTNPYPSSRAPVFARNLVATSQPLAAQAGLRMLALGGNAVDAAIAAAAALAITEPVGNGLGSDCYVLVWDGARMHGLDASGAAPGAWSTDYFRSRHQGRMPARGWDSVTVPGAIAGWAALHERLGSLPFAALLEPAIEYAERGYAVTPAVQRKWAAQVDLLQSMPGFADHFMPRGRAPAVGEHFTLRCAAETLRRVARTSGRDFYEGETAHKLVAHAQAHDAVLTLNDLRGYAPRWVDPVAQPYRGHVLHQLPSVGHAHGVASLVTMGILQHFDLAAQAPDHPDVHHLMIEAVKLALSNVPQSPDSLLDPARLAECAAAIDPRRAQPLAVGRAPQGGTVHVSAADRQGMMVSLVQSNHIGFGSGVVVPGTGVSLHNRGYAFSADPAHAHAVAGGKRPGHASTPLLLTRAGAPLASLGVMGGNMQPQGHVQTLVRMVDHGQQPQAACDAPRWRWTHGMSVDAEPTMPTALLDALCARGHAVERARDPHADFGSGQFVWRLGDPAMQGYVGASDGRRDGLAAGL